jgi:hypothetical protein
LTLPDNAASALPVPGQNIFEIPEKSYAVIALPSHHREQTVPAEGGSDRVDSGESWRTISRPFGHPGRHGAPNQTTRGSRLAVHAGRRELKHLVQVKKGSV